MLATTDVFAGVGTLALAVATFVLAAIAFWQLREARSQREITEDSLKVAEATLQAQQRPELIAFPEASGEDRAVHIATDYGTVVKPVGEVWARADLMNANLGVVSFDVCNIGPGSAEIVRLRVMSLNTLQHGGGPEYWEPHPADRRPIVVPAGGTAPVDLVMAPSTPSWFYEHLKTNLKFWVEVSYCDLGGVENHIRWFEFQQRSYQPYPWFIGQVRRSEPQPFSNLPPRLSRSSGRR